MSCMVARCSCCDSGRGLWYWIDFFLLERERKTGGLYVMVKDSWLLNGSLRIEERGAESYTWSSTESTPGGVMNKHTVPKPVFPPPGSEPP